MVLSAKATPKTIGDFVFSEDYRKFADLDLASRCKHRVVLKSLLSEISNAKVINEPKDDCETFLSKFGKKARNRQAQ